MIFSEPENAVITIYSRCAGERSVRAMNLSAGAAVLAAAAGGSLSDIETTVAMTAKDAVATFQAAGKAAKSFRSAGRS